MPGTEVGSVSRVNRRRIAYPALKPGTPEWRERRASIIGASEVPALFGDAGGDGYKSGYVIWLEKTGRSVEEPRDPTSPAGIGSVLESSLGQLYRLANAEFVRHLQPAWTEHDDEVSVLAATPDFDAFTGEIWESGDRDHCVQAKNRGGFPLGWGETGTDQVPRAVLVQVHAELAVTRLPFHRVVALLGGNRYAQYTIHRDDEICAKIRDVVSTWHNRHIVQGVEPSIEGPGIVEYFGRKFARALNETVVKTATPEHTAALVEALESKLALEAADLRYANAKAVCMSIIGENRGLTEAGIGKVLWFNKAGRRTISEASIRAALNSAVLDGDVSIADPQNAPAVIEKIIATATTKADDYREFRCYPEK